MGDGYFKIQSCLKCQFSLNVLTYLALMPSASQVLQDVAIFWLV